MSSFTGCVDNGTVTLDCRVSDYLVVHGGDFGEGWRYYLQVAATLSDGSRWSYLPSFVYYPPAWLGVSNDNSTRVFQLSIPYSPLLMTGTLLLNCSLSGPEADTASMPCFSLAYIPPPTLTAIGGCQGSGTLTSLCDPVTAVITLTGTSFEAFNQSDCGWRWIALAEREYDLCWDDIVSLSSTQLVLTLSRIYGFLLQVEDFDGAVLPLSLDSGSFSTNALNISFIAIQPPSITSITASSCSSQQRGDNSSGLQQTYLTDCRPELSRLRIKGHYLYSNRTVTVGGAVCSDYASSGGAVFSCTLSAPPDYAPGRLYDLVLSTSVGSITLPRVVAFTGLPTIYSIPSCSPTPLQHRWYELRCFSSQTLWLLGSRFQPDLPFNISISAYPLATLSCLQPTFVNSSAVRCTLPPVPADQGALFYNYYVQVQLSYNATVASNRYSAVVYDFPNSPRVTAVSGCDAAAQSQPLTASGCGGGDQLTLYGSGFVSGMRITAFPVHFLCSEVTVTMNGSQATCLLPQYSDDELSSYTAYELTISAKGVPGSNGNTLFSNAFTVYFAFAQDAASSSGVMQAGSAGSGDAIVIAVPIVVCVMLCICVALGWRVWKLRMRRNSSGRLAQSTLESEMTGGHRMLEEEMEMGHS